MDRGAGRVAWLHAAGDEGSLGERLGEDEDGEWNSGDRSDGASASRLG
ncbi:hypothetical protein RBWH47_04612 [Rhodopirellula baltica WH47]|uniref:Uncharacterized protein n=1 Tax=Rhodopirellula baltica WH47 TaxID=991778 RepID=F2AQ85_RHOBT|nr:hypothetical protein RBWH47_04612 [Rhodopirellula baltica WH47]